MAMMMLQLAGKGFDMSFRLVARTMRELIHMAAFLRSLWVRSSAKGKVNMMRLLKDGGAISAVAMSADDFKNFEQVAKSERIMYHTAHREDNNTYLVTVRSEDLQRMQTALNFWTLDADAKTVAEVFGDESVIEENEMRLSDFEQMVEANKDNSEEMRLVHDVHFPKLKSYDDLQVSFTSLEEYTAFKEVAVERGILFAPVVNGGEVLLAYRAADMDAVKDIIGRDLENNSLVSDAEIEARTEEKEQKAVDAPMGIAAGEVAISDVKMQIDPDITATEMRLSEFSQMVEANKDNSPEMQTVYETHFPKLQKHDNLRVSVISVDEYTAFKPTATKQKIPFAPVVQNGQVFLAYRAADMSAVQSIIGRELEGKDLISDAQIENRKFAVDAVGKESVPASDFYNQKNELIAKNGGIDFDEWLRTAADHAQLPSNTVMYMEVDPEVVEAFQAAEYQERNEQLNEAKAIDDLRDSNVVQMSDYVQANTREKEQSFEK